jgi:hypothetical protein
MPVIVGRLGHMLGAGDIAKLESGGRLSSDGVCRNVGPYHSIAATVFRYVKGLVGRTHNFRQIGVFMR